MNPPALAFGALFLLQAVLFVGLAYGRKRLDVAAAQGLWRLLGLSFMGYSLVYPALGPLLGLEYPRMPTFGVPCPTVILTVGFLLTANLRVARWIAVTPLLWSTKGGSAAFLLGIRAGLVLALSGVALLARVVASFTHSGEDLSRGRDPSASQLHDEEQEA